MLHIKNGSLFSCELCGKKSSTKPNLTRHTKTHQPKKFACEVCGKDFSTSDSLKRHEKIHSGQRELFKCDVCDKAFTRKDFLIRHQVLHSGIKAFKCDHCSKQRQGKIILDKNVMIVEQTLIVKIRLEFLC